MHNLFFLQTYHAETIEVSTLMRGAALAGEAEPSIRLGGERSAGGTGMRRGEALAIHPTMLQRNTGQRSRGPQQHRLVAEPR